MAEAINLEAKLRRFDQYWLPRTIVEFTKNDILLAKVRGAFPWHIPPDTGDFFLILKSEIDIQMKDQTISLNAGEVFVVSRCAPHRPVAKIEAHLLLIEPTGTQNIGDKATAAARCQI